MLSRCCTVSYTAKYNTTKYSIKVNLVSDTLLNCNSAVYLTPGSLDSAVFFTTLSKCQKSVLLFCCFLEEKMLTRKIYLPYIATPSCKTHRGVASERCQIHGQVGTRWCMIQGGVDCQTNKGCTALKAKMPFKKTAGVGR